MSLSCSEKEQSKRARERESKRAREQESERARKREREESQMYFIFYFTYVILSPVSSDNELVAQREGEEQVGERARDPKSERARKRESKRARERKK